MANHSGNLGKKTDLSGWKTEMITEPEWTPAGVWILGRSRNRSQFFEVRVGAGTGVNIKVRAGANHKFYGT